MSISIKTLTILLLVFTCGIVHSQEELKPKLEFSHPHGFYKVSFVLTITSNIPGSKIYYTLDGSNPITSDAVFFQNSPLSIEINPNNTLDRDYAPGYIVRAYIEYEGAQVSEVKTRSYIFVNKIIELSRNNVLPGPGWLEFGAGHDISYGLDPDVYNNAAYSNQIETAFLSIPSISLVTNLESLFSPDSGIYVNALYHGKEWERSASIELLNPDGSDGFQTNCGLRIRGGWSRHYDNPKHAFRFIFREEYGNKKLNYPLFGEEGVDRFDNIDLRTAQNYSWSYNGDDRNTFIREVFSRDTQRDMEQPYTRSRYYHLYINGTYWGLYQTQERSEASFAESYFGGNAEDYDVIKVDVGDNFDVYNVEATDGSLSKWKLLWDYTQIGFSDYIYYKVQGLNTDGTQNPIFEKLLDVDNLIDYMIITFFVGDFDGPISGFSGNVKPNNFYAIYNRVNPDGFKFFRHDGEHTLFSGGWGEDRTGPFPAGERFFDSNPQWIHQKLSENKNYRLRFADRVYKHFFNNGALTLENNRSRINERKAQIESAIIAESARWGDSKGQLKTKVHWTNEINNILYNYLPSRAATVLNQLTNKELFFTEAPPQFNVTSGIVDKGFGVELNSQNGDIYYTTNGTDPLIPAGNESGNYTKTLIEESAVKRVLVPASAQSDDWYKELLFNDYNWLICNGLAGGIGYDDKQIYTPYISLDAKSLMSDAGSNPNTSCFIRIPFELNTDDYLTANKLYFDIRYDDGFVAYLNGEKVLEVNAPSSLSWNSTSSIYLDNQGFERFDLSNYLSSLNDGENLLAIHGLNISTQSSDFLILPTLTIARESLEGTISPYALKYNSPIPIDETTTIKTRSLLSGNWSMLNESKFIIDENLSAIKITELHYHPTDEIVGQDTINDREFEFIEFKNIGTQEINLTGSYFSRGITFSFPSGTTITPDSFIILASNSIEFNRRYGFNPNFEYEGQLDNSGETLEYKNAAEKIVFSFKYNDKAPWPVTADGDGYSIVSLRRNPLSNPADSDYWTASNSINGSPGYDDLVSDINDENKLSNKYLLYQNFPNPFNPTTTINYSIPVVDEKLSSTANYISLMIYDILGREVTTLVNEIQKPGNYQVQFDASQLTSGIYFYRLKSNDFYQTKRMLLVK